MPGFFVIPAQDPNNLIFPTLEVTLHSKIPLSSPRISLSRRPTSAMASIAGLSSFPISVRRYSTVGGDVGITFRRTMPSSSSFLRRCVNTLEEIPCTSLFRSLKQRGSLLRYQMILGVPAPPITPRQTAKEQVAAGLADDEIKADTRSA